MTAHGVQLPHSALYERQSLLREAWKELVETYRFRPLVRALVSTALRTENVGTVFGYLWWLLDPLLLGTVYYLLVNVIFQQGGEDFALFIFTSVVVWKYFSAGVRNALVVTVAKERQMRPVRFPRSVLPTASILAETVRFGFGISMVIVAASLFGIFPHYALLFLPVVVAVQLVFMLGIAFFLSALNVFFRDVQHLTDFIFRGWFFLSPGLYPLALVPNQFGDFYHLNPFATILPAYHSLVMDHALPDLFRLGIVAGVSALLLFAGYVFFVRLQPLFAKVS